MPATYSISVGLPTEAFRKPDINSVLLDLPDNTQKLISPKDVRDSFLSTWANAAFKQTIGLSSIEYIGIDSGNPSDRDIKQKIFIGKRNYAGVDIMNSNLLSPSNINDIYFFNTKPDNITQSSTRIAILAGTNSTLYNDAPYIESKLNNTGTAIDLNIVNPSVFSGPINIFSQTGRVSINGIVFPTATETAGSASNGRILKYSGTYPNGTLRWDDPNITISSIGVPGTPTNIYGSSSYVNGYSLEFIDDAFVSQTIGGVGIGSSFSAFSFNGIYGTQNWPLVEVIRKILYPYVPPTVQLQLSNNSGTSYAEIGFTTSINFTYSISKYSYNIDNYRIVGPGNTTPYVVGNVGTYSGLSFSGLPGDSITVTFSYPVRRNYTSTPITNNYVLQVSDSGLSFYTHSSTASLTFISPIYSYFNTLLLPVISVNTNTLRNIMIAASNSTVPLSASKHIIPYPGVGNSVRIPYAGSGYLYFIYPSTYGELDMIKDPNGFVVHDRQYLTSSTFTYSIPVTPNPGGLPPGGQGQFRVYRTIGTCSYSGIGEFEFTFSP